MISGCVLRYSNYFLTGPRGPHDPPCNFFNPDIHSNENTKRKSAKVINRNTINNFFHSNFKLKLLLDLFRIGVHFLLQGCHEAESSPPLTYLREEILY